MKNGDFNKTEELLQKRFDGVKNDIKDPGFINIKYKEKENKESFFKKPAVYAAGLVLVAVLVCGGTFIGLKLLERIGAQNVASSSTPSINENSETTDEIPENKGFYPVYLKIECCGKSEYPQSYMRWESVNDGENENIKYASGTNSEYRDLDNVIIFESAVLGFQWYYTPEDGMEATVKCRMAGEEELFDIGDIQSILGGCARGKIYRLIAVAEFETLSDGVTRKGCYEYPFDFYYIDDSESAGYRVDTEEITEEVTTGADTEETTDITLPKGKPPVYLKVFDANEIIYPDAYGLWDTEGAKNVPVLHYDGSDIDIAYVQPSGRCYVGYRRYGSDEEEHISVDYINDYLKHAHTGNYRFIVNFSIETGDEITGYDYPFDVEVLIKEETTGADTEETVSNIGDYNGDFFVTVGDVSIHPDAYMLWEIERNNKTGSVERKTGTGANGKLENVLKITYKDSLSVGYTGGKSTGIHKGEMTEITYRHAGRSGMSYYDMKAYLDGSGSGTYRIVADVVYSVTSGDITYRGVYEFPFDVIVLKPEVTEGPEPLQIVLTNHENREYSYYVGKHAGDGELFNVYLKNASNLASVSVTVSWDERLELTRAEYPTRPDWYPDDLFYETCKKNHSYTFEWKADDPADAVSGDFLLMRLDFATPEHVASAFNIDFKVNTSGTYNTAGQNIPSSSKRIPIETVYEQLEWPESIPETDPEPETDPVTETEETTTYAEGPGETVDPDLENGKYPVYLTVKCGDQTIYPDAYGLWTTQYDDKEGGWLEGDGWGAYGAENVPVIEFDGGAAIKIGYKTAGNGTRLWYRINKGEEYRNVSFDEINSFFKHAEPGTYRVIVTCEVKGRLIEGQYDTPDGRYESTGWEYPFDVTVK